jgi:hypothetical protein
MQRHVSRTTPAGAVLLSLALVAILCFTCAPSSSAAPSPIKSPQPVLISQVGQSSVLYVLWTRNCANDRSCYALERSDDGGQFFTRVNAPPITFARSNQSGPLYELVFANADDGLAVVQSATTQDSLFVTFNGGTSWHRNVIRPYQRIITAVATPSTFYAVSTTCMDPDRSCRSAQLDSAPVASSQWTAHLLPSRPNAAAWLPNIAAFGNDVWLTSQEQGKPYAPILETSYNGGATFSVRSKPLLNSVAGCSITATSTVTLWAECDQGMMTGDIVYSHDGGATWSYGHGGLGRFGFGTFDPISTFASVFVNYFPGGQLQGVQFLPTAASTAIPLGRAPAKGISELAFVDPEQGLALGHGYGVGDFATLYETSDGGKRWRTSSLVK